MKTIILALSLSLVSTVASANFVEYSLEVTTYQAIGATVANIVNASSQATTNSKVVAVQIQNDIADYNQSGVVSLFLADKIAMVNSLNSELSEQDAVDVLIEAAAIILK